MLVETVQKFVEILQFWTRLLVCPWCAETADAPQLQFIDSLVHAPAFMQRLVPMVQTVLLGLEAWAAHFLHDELWVSFRPCTQVQGRGSCPQGHGSPLSGALCVHIERDMFVTQVSETTPPPPPGSNRFVTLCCVVAKNGRV